MPGDCSLGHSVYEHLRQLSDPAQDSDRALRHFAECLQQNFAPTAAAFISTQGLTGDRYRLLGLYRGDGNGGFTTSGLFSDQESPPPVEADPVIGRLHEAGELQCLAVPWDGVETHLARQLERPVALLAIPLFLDGVVDHWLLIGTAAKERFAAMDGERAVLLGNLAFTYMARISDIRRLRAAHDRLQGELCKIAHLQQMLLPALDGQIRGLSKAAHFQACDEAGGDYYDIVRLSQYADPPLEEGGRDYWGAIIADAAGHGAAAAVEVAMFDAILRTYREGVAPGPAHVFDYANRHLFTRLIRGSYITAFAANFDPQRNLLRYVNAGHPPPLLRRARGGVEYLPGEATGIPLGVTQDYQWSNAALEFLPGDLLLLYTDGVTEAQDRQGRALGSGRLAELLAQTPGDAETVLMQLRTALEAHQAGARRRDDQTMLVLQLESHDG